MWLVFAALFSRTVSYDLSFAQQQQPLIKTENLKKYVFELSADAYEGRRAGYQGEKKAAEVIAKQFASLGLKPVGDRLNGSKTYFQKFTFYPRKSEKPFQKLISRNVVGFIEGNDPQLKKEIIVIGVHYDA